MTMETDDQWQVLYPAQPEREIDAPEVAPRRRSFGWYDARHLAKLISTVIVTLTIIAGLIPADIWLWRLIGR